jgi:hypothetical protein
VDIETRPSGQVRGQQPGVPDQKTLAPLAKGDFLIVGFVSSIWLWAAIWAIASSGVR